MEDFELGTQLGEVLLVHQLFDQRAARHLLVLDQALDQGVPMQELLHLAQVLFQILDFEPGQQIGHVDSVRCRTLVSAESLY